MFITEQTELVRVVPAVVHVVADIVEVNTGSVGTLELIEHAGLGSGSTDGHVVLIQSVVAVLEAVTHLVVVNTLPVTALELIHFITGEVIAELRSLVTVVTTVVNIITEIVGPNTQMVVALVSVGWTIFAVILWLTVHLI